MKISKKEIELALLGSTILGAGGGGSYEIAKKLLKDINSVELLKKEEIKEKKEYATIYGIGKVNEGFTLKKEYLEFFEYYEKLFGSIDGIIIGEIGPLVIAMNILYSKFLNVPLIDTDAGGFRSIPSTEYEIFNFVPLKRLPLFIFSSKNFFVIKDLKNKDLDFYLDKIYEMESEILNVIGYRNTGLDLLRHLPFGSFTFSIEVGKALVNNQLDEIGEKIGTFRVLKKTVYENPRFYEGEIVLEDNVKIYFKNEFMHLTINGEKVVDFPDIIALVDLNQKRGLLTSEVEEGKKVEVWKIENKWFKQVLK